MKTWLNCLSVIGALALGACKPATNDSELQGKLPFSDGFISSQVRMTIGGELAHRCEDVFMREDILRTSCEHAMRDLGDYLGFSYRSSGDTNIFAFFESELMTIMNDGSGVAYLRKFSDAVELANITNKPINAFDFTLNYFEGDLKKATKFLAVLFQDDISVKTQVRYLQLIKNPNWQLLNDALALINEGEKAGTLAMYPAKIKITGRGFYHYYVPSYLAMRLIEERHEPDMAYLAPFMFNAIYELRQVYEVENPQKAAAAGGDPTTMRYNSLMNHLRAPMNPFDANRNQDGLKDMWLGYSGATVGASGNLKAWYDDLRTFSLKMARDPALMFFIEQAAVPRR